MLDLDASRSGATPKDAATLVLVRDAILGTERARLEVFCVVRHQKSRFLGGAVVFPGGKLDEQDRDPEWTALTTPPRARASTDGNANEDDDTRRALAVAACRETLEEAALLPVEGERLAHEELLALRTRASLGESFRSLVKERGLRLDLAALHPFARWVTPVAEARRFDARLFLAAVSALDRGAHDEHETTSSFWATPAELLRRFVAGEIQLAPPTHRTLEILATHACAADAVAWSDSSCLDPICPQLVPQGTTMALVLPGDPEHDVREPRAPGASRFVLRGERWMPEDAPA
jgi:8-oxo-dGTP pyrophosphatase MutT (NUDIX family)